MRTFINAVKEDCNNCQNKKCEAYIEPCPGRIEKKKKGFTLLELALKNSLQEVNTLLGRASLVFAPNHKGYGFQLIKK